MAEPFKGATGGRKGIQADQRKTATASEAKDLLIVGMSYDGKVVGRSSDNTYTVDIHAPGTQVSGVRLASSVIAGLLGFKDSRKLSADCEVSLVYGNPGHIYATHPTNPPDRVNGSNRSVAWGAAVSDVQDSGQYGGTNMPEDMVEGDHDIDNLFGVGIRFLTSLIAMKAGERAKVECHLLNDMVRIISQQFRHIHGLGDDLIFDHGRPTAESSYTSYRHELMGKLTETEPLFPLKGDEIDKDSIDRVNTVARHRYLEYVGHMGDFIHRFVCDPPATMVKLHEAATGRRAGKFWEHVGSDGSYVVHSTAEIRFERVTRLPVPHRIASHEDPEVTKARKYRELNKDYLKMWDYGSAADKDAYRTTYQLRQYARWLTRFQAFARAIQLDAEFDLRAENDPAYAPDWNNAEEDRRAANADLEYFEAYSCYCILRDGSQILHDGYGSSVVLSNGNVQISASRHLELEAAGDVRLVAGGSIFMKARRHIELSASAGGIIIHSYAFLRALCEKGSVWLRSDAVPPEAGGESLAKAGVEPAIEPEVLDSAILIESALGKFAVRSEKQISLTVEGAPEDAGDLAESTADIVLSTNGSVRAKASKHIILGAAKDLVTSSRYWSAKASKWYGDFGDLAWGKFFLSPNGGRLQIDNIDVKTLRAERTILGPRVRPLPIPDEPVPSKIPVGPHINHIRELKEDSIEWHVEDEPTAEAQAAIDFAGPARRDPVSPWATGAEDAQWGFLKDATYYWDSREERKGALVQTLTQQYITCDSPTLWGSDDHYEEWDWKMDRLTLTKRANDNKLGFGGNATQYRSGSGDNLHVPGTKTPATLGAAAKPEWVTRSVAFHTLKQTS